MHRGFMTSGIIGLFVAASIFALGYKLFLLWLNEETSRNQSHPKLNSGHPVQPHQYKKVFS